VTEPTTADILAAGELLQSHAPCLMREDGAWLCSNGHRGTGATWVAAVRAWAKVAEIEWPAVKVVPMWAVVDGDRIDYVTDNKDDADTSWSFFCVGRVVPCEAVIRESEGV
jgi:hypothetical protein